nr:CDP-glucose 4,6-dehydratase [uncultured Rhodoferax sp.]
MAIRPGPLEGLGVNLSFWRDKRVFLTGHTGFKGGWLSLWLQQLGAELTGYALQPPTQPNLFEKARVGAGMTSIIGDMRDGAKLMAALRDAAPDIVIHMAAQPLVRRSYLDPVETYSTNVMGTVHLLEAVRQCASARAVVNVTTDKCYENREWLWPYRENEAMGGYDPYSSSKGCAELVTAAYRNSYFNANTFTQHRMALASARAGNVIGGGDWAEDRLVPDILGAFARGEPVGIRNPHAVRPWQHVLEPLRGYLTLAERLFVDGTSFAEAFNFGPREDDAQPVDWIVRQLAIKWGDSAKWQVDGANHPHEASLLRLDVSKAAHRLAWRPELNLDAALQLTVDWTRANLDGQDMHVFTGTQISDYQTRVAVS